MNNWQEWRAQTDPTNPGSLLRIVNATRSASEVLLNWQSVAGVKYFLERATNLGTTTIFSPIVTNVTGGSGTTSFIDTNAAGARLFYRVGVQ